MCDCLYSEQNSFTPEVSHSILFYVYDNPNDLQCFVDILLGEGERASFCHNPNVLLKWTAGFCSPIQPYEGLEVLQNDPGLIPHSGDPGLIPHSWWCGLSLTFLTGPL